MLLLSGAKVRPLWQLAPVLQPDRLPFHGCIPGQAGRQVDGGRQCEDGGIAKLGGRQGAGDEVCAKAHKGGCAIGECEQLAGVVGRHILRSSQSVRGRRL